MKRIALLVVLTVLSTSAPAAQIEFGDMSCGAYVSKLGALAESNMQAASTLLVWMYGYGAGVSGGTMFDQEGFERFSRGLAEHCLDNVEMPILDAARVIGGR